MFKNYTKTIGLFVVIALLLRRATKFLVAGVILASSGMAILPGSIRFTSTFNRNMGVRGFELAPLTGTVGYSRLPSRPIHDPGTTGGTSNPGVGLPSANPITYTVNGYTVVRRFELGPLTGTIENPPPRHGPGHDYGAIGDESDPPMSLPAISPFTYTVNGYTVVLLRHGPGHDFGAIGDESDPPMGLPATSPFTYTVNGYTVVLLTHGPGHDFGVLGDEYNSAMSQSYSSPITYTVNGYTVVRRSELGPLK